MGVCRKCGTSGMGRQSNKYMSSERVGCDENEVRGSF